MSGFVDVDVWLQVEPRRSSYSGSVMGARLARATSRKPRDPLGDTVMVKVTLRIPRAAFNPLTPSAVIEVPESMAVATPVVAEVADPS